MWLRRALLLVAAASPWELGACVSVTNPHTHAKPHLTQVELRSSGSLIRTDAPAAPAAAAAEGKEGPPEEWPETAIVKGEVKLGRLHGGTKPEQVRIGPATYVRKKALEGEPQSIMMEALANNIYEAARVKSEHCRYYPAVKGTTAYMLCRWIDGLQPIMDFTEDVKKVVSEHFVLDAVLGNYDVGGMNGDNNHRYPRGNIGWDHHKQLVRVDNGGALAADGMGVWKPTEYTCKERFGYRLTTWSREPFSLWDFRRYSEVYGQLSRRDIEAQAKTVLGMKEDLLKAVDSFGNAEATQKVKATLKARLDCLERITKEKAELFDIKYLQAPTYYLELPKTICEGVRTVCADLLVHK